MTGGAPGPDAVWQTLLAGNERFVSGRPRHSGQDAAARAQLAEGQRPAALVFGCSDSRVPPELVFDQGLGDLFVVRTAGHVLDPGVLGTLEFGVLVLGISLVVVLGHEGCGAVAATVQALDSGDLPPGHIGAIVDRVAPSVLAARSADSTGPPDLRAVEATHVRRTVDLLTAESAILADAVGSGRCVVVGATYQLDDGRVEPRTAT